MYAVFCNSHLELKQCILTEGHPGIHIAMWPNDASPKEISRDLLDNPDRCSVTRLCDCTSLLDHAAVHMASWNAEGKSVFLQFMGIQEAMAALEECGIDFAVSTTIPEYDAFDPDDLIQDDYDSPFGP